MPKGKGVLINIKMDKKLAFEELDRSRRYHDEKLFNLVIGKATLNIVKDKMKKGNEAIQITYGPNSSITDRLDEEFFARHHIQLIDFNGEILKLIKKESEAEYQIRREAIRNYINQHGLKDYTKEIIDGLNKSAERVSLLNHTQWGNEFGFREVLLYDSRAFLNFGFDYVDRWKMYNELFGRNPN